MNLYVTGTMIKSLREKCKLTQLQLADRLGVSDKTVSKWETGKGYPDITLLEPIADALSVSVAELLSGNTVCNSNVSANVMRSRFYICPVCGNIIHSMFISMAFCCSRPRQKKLMSFIRFLWNVWRMNILSASSMK